MKGLLKNLGLILILIGVVILLACSFTGGRASFIMKFASYELVPTDVQDKLIKDFEAKQTEE